MPKLNTFAAAALAATTLIAPVNAGEPNSHYAPTGYSVPVYTGPAPSYGHNQSGASGAATGYAASQSYASSGSSYASSTAYASSGPVNITADDIVCMMGNQEVPCDSVLGLSEALHAQGLHSIADALPPARPGLHGYGAPVYVGGYTGNQYASASANSYASNGGYAYAGATASAGTAYDAATSTTLRTTRTSGYGATERYISTAATGYGHGYHGHQAPGYASEVWVTPCGQVITKQITRPVSPCAAPVQYVPAPVIYEPAPISVRLSDGTMYALNGGVGAGIYGEFYGGGGSVIQSGSRYSGVLNASASQFTFKHKKTPRPTTRYPKPKPRYPKGGGHCGGGC